MKKRLRTPVMVLAVVAALVGASALPVSADGKKGGERITVSGNSVPSDCNDGEGAGAIALTGDLEGCLTFFPKRFTCDELNGFARYRESGTESFEGTLHGEPGRFSTSYTLEATYESGSCAEFEAGGFPFLSQLTGGCDHYVRGRSGAFRGASGLITFFDVIPDPGSSGASNFLYAGTLKVRG